MTARPHSTAPAKRLSHRQWASIVDLYELGEKNQRELAELFGVSTAAIHMGLKKRGAVKGCRVMENPRLLHLERQLDAKARSKRAADDAAFERMNERTQMIGALIEMLLEADRHDRLAELGPALRDLRRAM
jgi:DNA-binding transcriptional regulator LsrR (DeoR family)